MATTTVTSIPCFCLCPKCESALVPEGHCGGAKCNPADAGGIHFALMNGHRRSVYRQLSGEWILADDCTCRRASALSCPIDSHAIKARQADIAV